MTSIALSTFLMIASTLAGITTGMPQRHARRAAADVAKLTLHCHIRITSYRFVGRPGTSIQWGHNHYAVPASGMIELIPNHKVSRYVTPEGEFPLPTEGPLDQFGIMTIDLASNQIVPAYKARARYAAPITLGSFDDVIAR